MERPERIGLTASAAGHGALIVIALVGGLFSHDDVSLPSISTEVSLISSDQFAALQAAAPTAPTESPDAPTPPPVAEEAETEPPAEETPPETAAPETPPEPEAEPAPDVSELEPPIPDASPEDPSPLPMPDVETPSETVLDEINPEPRPTDAGRVAPTPSDEPAPDAAPSDAIVTETAPQPDEALPEEEVVEEQAPEEATTQTPVEDEMAEVTQSSAPRTSLRPKGRPERPAPAPEPEVEVAAAEPADEPRAEDASDAAVEDALAEALAGAESEEPAPGTGVAASGPPLTSGEKDALVVAVKQCWNVGALSTDALRTVVTVGVTMGQDGVPDSGSIRMIGYEGGDETAAQQAFEAGRRAIVRCARGGYPLPAEKYDQWREIEIVFNPENMRMR